MKVAQKIKDILAGIAILLGILCCMFLCSTIAGFLLEKYLGL